MSIALVKRSIQMFHLNLKSKVLFQKTWCWTILTIWCWTILNIWCFSIWLIDLSGFSPLLSGEIVSPKPRFFSFFSAVYCFDHRWQCIIFLFVPKFLVWFLISGSHLSDLILILGCNQVISSSQSNQVPKNHLRTFSFCVISKPLVAKSSDFQQCLDISIDPYLNDPWLTVPG